MDLAEKLKEMLAEKGMMQRELAMKIGMTEASISRYIKGDRTPTAKVVKRMAEALGCSVSCLLGDDAKEITYDGLTVEDIQRIQCSLLNNMTSAWESSAEKRANMMFWIEGINDMTRAVIDAIERKQVAE